MVDKKINNLLKGQEVLTVPDDSKVVDVAEILIGACIQGIVVVNENNEPVGVVSEMDMLKAFGEDCAKIRVADIMNSPIKYIDINETLKNAEKTMRDGGIHRLVVTDENNKMVGILCARDIIIDMYRECKGHAH